MSKFFLNIFSVIIMGLCLTVVPVNIDMLDFENISFDFSKPKVETPSSENTSNNANYVFEVSTPSGSYLYNPDLLEIIVKSAEDLSTYPNELKENLSVDIFKFDSLVKSIKLNSLSADIKLTNESDINILSLSIPIDQITYNLKTGHYKLKISNNSASTSFFENLEYDVTYIDNYKYLMATDDTLGKTLDTIYYPSKNLIYSVPVSREVSSKRNSQIRSILNAIVEGPSPDSGLNIGPAGPYISSAATKNGILTLKTNSSEIEKFNASGGPAALSTMTKSLLTLPNIKEIQFLVNGSISSSTLGGVSLKDGLTLKEESMIYLGYQTENEYNYLIPLSFGLASDVNIESMFEALKTAKTNGVADEGLLQSVPQNVTILKNELLDGVLTLDLSNEFMSSYDSNKDYSMLMLDSIVYSYTSYPTINSVRILVDGKEVSDFFGINISSPMSRKSYINPRFN